MGGFTTFPALDIRPPENPLDQYAKALSVKSMIGGQQLQKEQITGSQQENQIRAQQLKDVQATTAAMQEWDGKSYQDLLPLVIKHGGSSNAVIGLQKQTQALQEQKSVIAKNDAETGAKNLETQEKKNNMLLGHLATLDDEDDADLSSALKREKNAALLGGYIDKAHADAIDQLAAVNDPQKIRGALDIFKKGLIGQKEQFDQAYKERDLASKEWKEFAGLGTLVNERTGEVKNVAGQALTPQMMESKYVSIQQQIAQGGKPSAEDAAFVKGYEKMKTLVPMFNFNLSGGATGGLTPDAIDQQAEKYFSTGTLPPVGRSAAGLALTRKIMQRASELHPGESLAAGSAEYKANSASLKALQSNLDQVSAFEQTAIKNLDMFTGLARKAADSGLPILNAPLRTAASLLGSTDQASFDAARQVAVNEIAKVTSSPGLSGQLSDTARREVASFIPQSATVGQILHLADTLKQDMANRHQSYQEQIEHIKGRLGAGGSSSQQSPQGSVIAKPPNATHTGIGSVDKKKHWLDAGGRDLGPAE